MSESSIRIGIIGGSGMGERLAADFAEAADTHNIETPFGKTSGPIMTGRVNDTEVALLSRHGDGHMLNPSAVPYRANIFALKTLGVTHIVASGATGSLREQIHPGDLVLVDQAIDKTDGRARTFFERAAVHVEFADPCCEVMRSWLSTHAEAASLAHHQHGTYVCMEGPAFSTRAESEMHRQWGGDVIGMTALPEARLAREAEIAYALVALPTDYDCWRVDGHTGPMTGESLIAEIIGNLNRASDAFVALVRAALTDTETLRSHRSLAHDALALGIWSDKTKIDPAEIERLRPIWGRHFTS